MAKTQTILNIFLASPGDVSEERQLVGEIIDEFNITWSKTHDISLALLKWETHTRPSFGEDAQDVVNKQIGDDYDIFLGLMWGRFGSPTNRAESGTEEEFERAYSRLSASPQSVQIMFYFKDAGIPPSKLDPEQITKVKAFKQKLSSDYGGLFHEFRTADEFQTKLRIHLSKLVQDWLANPMALATGSTTSIPAAPKDKNDPLANLSALIDDDDDDDGLFDLVERGNDAMEAVVDTIEKMTEAVDDVGEKMRQRTNEIDNLSTVDGTLNQKIAKRISNNVANDFEIYVSRMAVEIPEFQKQHTAAMDAFGKIAVISVADFEQESDNIEQALLAIQKYRDEIINSNESISSFCESIVKWRRMTTALNRARKRVIAVTSDLIEQFTSASSQAEDVEELFNRLIDQPKKG